MEDLVYDSHVKHMVPITSLVTVSLWNHYSILPNEGRAMRQEWSLVIQALGREGLARLGNQPPEGVLSITPYPPGPQHLLKFSTLAEALLKGKQNFSEVHVDVSWVSVSSKEKVQVLSYWYEFREKVLNSQPSLDLDVYYFKRFSETKVVLYSLRQRNAARLEEGARRSGHLTQSIFSW